MAPDTPEPPADFDGLVGEKVVVDTDTTFIVIGTLETASDTTLTVVDADVHDMRDSVVTREVYALDVAKVGVRANRRRAFVRIDRIVAVSRLDDVIKY